MIFSRIALLFLLNVVILQGFSQSKNHRDSSESIPFIRFQYAHLLPSGDFEETFDNSNSVGGAFGFKTASNFQFEIEGNFMFGSRIKRPDLLSSITNQRGDITDSEGELVKIIYDLRGFSIFASAGRVFSFKNTNPNSGILTQFDRLHSGLALKQFVGYQHFGRKNRYNFYLGFEFQQGFTKNRREYNYDTQSFDKGQKFDLLYGFRIGWSIPIRERASEDFYYR